MLTIMRSRRMPALLIRTSSLPNVAIASSISAFAPAQSLTSLPFTMASPPACLIASTTDLAGVGSEPSPAAVAPRSLTTTFAPCSASINAYSRPRPRPAPVTIATRPAHRFPISPLLIPGFPIDEIAEQLPVGALEAHQLPLLDRRKFGRRCAHHDARQQHAEF